MVTACPGDYAIARRIAIALADPRAPPALVALAHDNVAALLVREDTAGVTHDAHVGDKAELLRRREAQRRAVGTSPGRCRIGRLVELTADIC